MADADRNDLDALAGEYVLGTLPADERRAAEARYAADPSFRRAVSEWEVRLQPLADAAGEVPVHGALFNRILTGIDSAPPRPAEAGDLPEQLRGKERLRERVREAQALLRAQAQERTRQREADRAAWQENRLENARANASPNPLLTSAST